MRALPVLSSVLAASILLAGCVDSGVTEASIRDDEGPALLTQPSHQVRADSTRYAMHDGTEIDLRIYRPADEGQYPVILVPTPYRTFSRVMDAALPAAAGGLPRVCTEDRCYFDLVDFYVPRGYAVAYAAARGTHDSGGCAEPYSLQMGRDMAEVVEALAAEPWSSGRVGTFGGSYDAALQLGVASFAPPHLATIVPIASVTSLYDFMYTNGVPYSAAPPLFMGTHPSLSLLPGKDPTVFASPDRFSCVAQYAPRAADLSGDGSAFWDERDHDLRAGSITTSVLLIHGLQDWNAGPHMIDDWPALLTNASDVRAIYGQWGHALPTREDFFGHGGILHRWYDHHLHGIDSGILADLPPALVHADGGGWRGLDAWAPADAPRVTLALTRDGALAEEPGPAGAGTLVDAPTRELESAAGGVDAVAATGLVFTSEPLTEPLHVSGNPRLWMPAETDATSTHWALILRILGEDGASRWVTRGYQDTRHLAGVHAPAPLTPGERYEVDLRLIPIDLVVQPGERIQLIVSNEDDLSMQDTTFATSRVMLGEGGATLSLPVADPGQAYPEGALVPWEG